MPLISKLNSMSNYLIDWSRVGELIKSGRHKYTLGEIVPRMFIGICTCLPISIYGFSPYTIVSSITVFIVSHLIVISPLMKKRNDMKKDCDNLIKMIKNDWCKCSDNKLCDTCYKISIIMTDNDNMRSSTVWGSRRRKLNELLRINNESCYYSEKLHITKTKI